MFSKKYALEFQFNQYMTLGTSFVAVTKSALLSANLFSLSSQASSSFNSGEYWYEIPSHWCKKPPLHV